MSGLRSGSHVAERLYYDSTDLQFRAEVTDIQLVAQELAADGAKRPLWRVSLDQTAFYPESGGQPWDTGMLLATARSGAVLEVPVERVEEDEAGEVWHFVRKPLVQGTEVEGRIDAARRQDHMQQHSGQHLLSALFLARLGARTMSFHLGAETSTIDLAFAKESLKLDRMQMAEVEDQVNQLIFEDRLLRAHWRTRGEAEAMLASGELRKLPDRAGPLRVIEIENVEWNACGGTHVPSTGAIGGLLLRRLEKVRQGWRVEFVCGSRAVAAARHEYEVLSSMASSLSVGTADVPGRLRALQDEAKAAAKLSRTLLDELADAKATELAHTSAVGDTVKAVFTGKSVDFAKRVASNLASSGRVGVVGVTAEGKGALAVALPQGDLRHAGDLLREEILTLGAGARGGGGPQLAQAVCELSLLNELVAAMGQRLR